VSKVRQVGEFFLPAKEFSQNARIKDLDSYKQLYDRSLSHPGDFWGEIAGEFYWQKKWDKVRDFNIDLNVGPVGIHWFQGGRTNISYNCLDRHLENYGDQVALIWEGNEPTDSSKMTYRELHQQVCRFANVLKQEGVVKGDRVALYMPMVNEAVVAMLACARIGAVHSVVFGGFSAESLAGRILDSKCRVLITADGVYRGSKIIPLKEIANEAINKCAAADYAVESCIVFRRLGNEIDFQAGRDIWWHEAMDTVDDQCDPEWMDAEDPLFILYTSGSTGKPKGVLHSTGGYMVFTATTFKYVFDYQPGEVYWCTADVGWVTGHSYIVYGPLANAATCLVFEGIPTYPDAGRFWQVVDKHQVNIFYTAPTAIRAIAALGDEFVTRHQRSSLRILGTVGEPINPEAWLWYHRVVGEERCPIVDTWWQTETGGILLSPIPGAIPTKPGSATLPFFGVEPVVLDSETGKVLEGEAQGVLAIKATWPGQMRTLYGDHGRFEQTYFSAYKGYYFTGDGVRRDRDGYFWIIGRVDDVINVSGHRLGTAEVESALVEHKAVAEAAVVGYPHGIKGTGVYAFVTLNHDIKATDDLRRELTQFVRTHIGAFATPDVIHWAPALPKTRSGKIMRRILRKIAAHEVDQIGDTSTLADPSVVEYLVKNR
jgi:acetyl-CoA synthetase